MFGTVLTVAYSVLLAYVIWRAASVPWFAAYLPPLGFAGLGVVLWVLFYLGRHIGHGGTGLAAAALEFVGMNLLGAMLIIATCTLAVDLATLFGWGFSKWAPAIRGGAIAAGACLSVFALIQGFRLPAIISQEVVLPGLPAGLDGRVIVAVADAHVGARLGEAWFTRRLKMIRELNPDIVVFVGDMFEGHGDGPREIPALNQLSAPLGRWFVIGNHGRGTDANILARAGFRRLANEWAEVAPGLVLAGVDDLTRHRRRGKGDDLLGKALANRPEGATILLSHAPWHAERAARAGVGLMLSGHTHGGQIWPFGYLVRMAYPLLAGRYEVEGMSVIVTRGVGTWGPRMRLWRRGEIIKLIIRKP